MYICSIRSLLSSVLPFATVLTLSACNTAPRLSAQQDGIQQAWTVLGEQGQGVARVVTTDNVCPVLMQDGKEQVMTVRAFAGTVAQRKTASSPDNSKPSAFPVLTCEATLSPTTRVASIGARKLPLPQPVAKKIVVIGDTGCRLKLADNYFQSCSDSEKWAFRSMVEAAAKTKPDLVIHVGDYHYRENACPEGNKDCAGSPWGYGWDTWKADFFDPAQALLKAAPWVMVRGNHETCTRAGQGWWRFLDPRPLQSGRDCNAERDDASGDYSPPYAVPLGRVGQEAAQLIVFDSSKVPNKTLGKNDVPYQVYMEQFKTVNQLSDAADFNIFINHHPILGLGAGRNKEGGLTIWPGNAALQGVMHEVNSTRLFPSKVQATLAGHVHLFEALTFNTDHPVQFVSGNGGSSLDSPLPAVLPAGTTPYAAAEIAHFSNSNDVGFMVMERESQSWKMQAWNKNGKLMTECRTQGKKTQCQSFQ
ncbi:metallophosphoesterase family protein [Undibacterium sp. WLHG33]|uniref:metallophosphoesterase family protein n=1 Tax=Undibacterium sp. WLHG33 TaxID=3412482 RepID=UPI003C305820